MFYTFLTHVALRARAWRWSYHHPHVTNKDIEAQKGSFAQGRKLLHRDRKASELPERGSHPALESVSLNVLLCSP